MPIAPVCKPPSAPPRRVAPVCPPPFWPQPRAAAGAVAVAVAAAALIPLAALPASAQETLRHRAADRPLALRPTTLYSIGQADGHEWETFGNIAALVFDAEDNLYVLDAGNTRVFVFDRDGRHVRSFGRRGQGPGEFGFPAGLSVLRNGEIVVGDVMRGALQRFAPDGSPLPSHDTGAVRPSGRLAAHPHGGVVATAVTMSMQMEGRQPTPRVRELRWWPADGGESRALYTAPEQNQALVGTDRLRLHMPLAFAPQLHWGVLPNGDVAVNVVEEYRIEIVGADGRTKRVIERPIAPRRVTERDREAYRERQAGSRVVLGGAGNVDARAVAQLEASLANVEFNERIPVIRAFAVDPFGRLWVQRFTEVGEADAPIDLIAPDGSYMGTLPAQRMPNAFSATGRIAYLEADDLGVPRVVVKQVPFAR
jgi:hypothetical protein